MYIDFTVQEKNITYPTDAKLLKKIVSKCKKISEIHGFKERQSDRRILKKVYLDERFRNNPHSHKKILIPGRPKKTDSYRKKKKQHKLFCHRAAIELTIGHLKFDHRMSRNFLKGVARNVMNLLLAAAAFNFKRAINALLCFILKCLLAQKTQPILVATSITK